MVANSEQTSSGLVPDQIRAAKPTGCGLPYAMFPFANAGFQGLIHELDLGGSTLCIYTCHPVSSPGSPQGGCGMCSC